MPYPSNAETDDEFLDGDDDAATRSYRVTASELRAFIERVESLEHRKSDIQADIKEVYQEIKGRGYDAKAVRKLVALRKRDRDAVAEEEAVLTLYREALGDI